MKPILDSINAYEAWLETQTRVDMEKMRKQKEEKISKGGAFALIRATFHRWVEAWDASVAADELRGGGAPVVLAVGDLHADNFGTWRNAEDQAVWGVNDFDEACEMPLTSDLVRLAVSIALAQEEIPLAVVSRELLAGYADGLALEQPIFLKEDRGAVVAELLKAGDEDEFWKDLEKKKDFEPMKRDELFHESAMVAGLFDGLTPDKLVPVYCRVQKAVGLGSLGRRRFRLALVANGPSQRCYEAKAMVKSARAWLHPEARQESLTAELMRKAVRSRDPVLDVKGEAPDLWLIREVGPAFQKIELTKATDKQRDLLKKTGPQLFRLMGAEVANIHLGSLTKESLTSAVKALPEDWLEHDAKRMEKQAREDWDEWRKGR